MNRWKNWIEQGSLNLRAARNSLQIGDFAWTCFMAHQSAEATLKGLHQRLGQVVWGDSIADLLYALPEPMKVSEGAFGEGKGIGFILYPHSLS